MSAETALPSLDFLAAECSQKISAAIDPTDGNKKAQDMENLITKALGVLQEQGVYALFLFLLWRCGSGDEGENDEKRAAAVLVSELLVMLGKEPLGALQIGYLDKIDSASVSKQKTKILSHVADHIVRKNDTLFLVRDLFEQALIYARYTAKASKKGR
ncbi:hypothetical protein [Gelria sp. Kuro-4]|uniref:hypothetical protein n=1 Tax=Gelria sp. Kuro-4 TaxID=2796927 RepID=UPI001BEF5649|nr:hypothetical protein [Gelria sp. Kuro-4]BCV26026.1 hypothetical protein kuro4_27990 [Gelria sp. Kuro-4]